MGIPASDRGLGRVSVATSPPSTSRHGTHRVVSWLMLVKEELLKELILLLLRSLEKTKVSSFRKKELLPSPTLAMAIPQPGGQVVLTSTLGGGRWWRGRLVHSYLQPSALLPELALCLQGFRSPFPHLPPRATIAWLPPSTHHGNVPTKGISCLPTARPRGLSTLSLLLVLYVGLFTHPPYNPMREIVNPFYKRRCRVSE